MYHYGISHCPKLKLAATKLPAGKELYETAGQSEGKESLLHFARGCGDCPAEIEAATAESVELEWQIDGKRMHWGDAYRKDRWVILHNSKLIHGRTKSKNQLRPSTKRK